MLVVEESINIENSHIRYVAKFPGYHGEKHSSSCDVQVSRDVVYIHVAKYRVKVRAEKWRTSGFWTHELPSSFIDTPLLTKYRRAEKFLKSTCVARPSSTLPRTITYECSFRWENDNVQTLLMNKFRRIIAFTPPFITFPSLLASREVSRGKRIPLCEGEKDGSYRDEFLTPLCVSHILIFN